MSTHNGKIAQLPKEIRDELNERLEAGEQGDSLLAWLNSLSAVKKLPSPGRPKGGAGEISPQNLSNWRQGGYQDWMQQQERRELALLALDDAMELEGDTGPQELGNHLSVLLLAEYAAVAREVRSKLTDPAERLAQLQKMLVTLARVRQQDSQAGRVALAAERWELKQDEYEWKSADARAELRSAKASFELFKQLRMHEENEKKYGQIRANQGAIKVESKQKPRGNPGESR